MKNVLEMIEERNDGFRSRLDVSLIKQAGVTPEVFQEAENRVYFDGWFGPCSQEDWDEEREGNSLSVHQALDIITNSYDAVEDYKETHEWEDPETGEIYEEEEVTVRSEDIIACRFKYMCQIYGTFNV